MTFFPKKNINKTEHTFSTLGQRRKSYNYNSSIRHFLVIQQTHSIILGFLLHYRLPAPNVGLTMLNVLLLPNPMD